VTTDTSLHSNIMLKVFPYAFAYDASAAIVFCTMAYDLLPGSTTVIVDGVTWNEITFDSMLKFYLLTSMSFCGYIANYRPFTGYIVTNIEQVHELLTYRLIAQLASPIQNALIELLFSLTYIIVGTGVTLMYKYHIMFLYYMCNISDHWVYILILFAVFTYANVQYTINIVKELRHKHDELEVEVIVAVPDNIYHSIHRIPGELNVNQECCICYDPMDRDSTSKMNKCIHMYHTQCIAEWCNISRMCPMCRQ
jgi:hypothetical protein